jgi:hypothetical protein
MNVTKFNFEISNREFEIAAAPKEQKITPQAARRGWSAEEWNHPEGAKESRTTSPEGLKPRYRATAIPRTRSKMTKRNGLASEHLIGVKGSYAAV